jgi:hypothetical protein
MFDNAAPGHTSPQRPGPYVSRGASYDYSWLRERSKVYEAL